VLGLRLGLARFGAGSLLAERLAKPVTVGCLALGLAGLFACSSLRAPSSANKAAERGDAQILITTGSLDGRCYTALGKVGFVQPFSEAAIDPEGAETAARLRVLALKQYPRDADAVIGVRTVQNDVGTEVAVAGEAVRLEHRETIECGLRSVPKVIDTAAAIAAGAGMGAMVGGLATGTSGAMVGAAAGAAGMGGFKTYQAISRERSEQAQNQRETEAQQSKIEELKRQIAEQCRAQELSPEACASLLNKTEAAQSKAQ
jgi:hypothetical protein